MGSSGGQPRWRRRLAFALAAALPLFVPVRCLTQRVLYPLDGWDGALLGALLGHDTEFAPGYSEDGFSRIHLGMTKAQVEALVGRPLHDSPLTERGIGWYYSRSPGDTDYRCRAVLFEDYQTVTRIHTEFYVD